jgi:tetratricopeptide (TPR) repeat protein
VYLQWERYADAAASLKQALTMMPADARALYYAALVERNQGDLDAAVINLQKVIARFPRSIDAHRELGFSYYQQHKYALARTEYETVQGIEPDDLSAHYNLAIIYRMTRWRAPQRWVSCAAIRSSPARACPGICTRPMKPLP